MPMYPTNIVCFSQNQDYYGLYRTDGYRNPFGTKLVMTGTLEQVLDARRRVSDFGFYEGPGTCMIRGRAQVAA